MAATVFAFGIACATRSPDPIKTQVVTFPDGGLVEYNGTIIGRAPTAVVLPQDAQGKLTQRAEVRAVPNSKQDTFYAHTRVFEPNRESERVPNRILIDMRVRDTNAPLRKAELVEGSEPKNIRRASVPHTERSKPTQAVGLDRWNPGKY